MKLEVFFKIIESGILAEVKAFLQKEQNSFLLINSIHPTWQLRAIDIAASQQAFEILDYLIQQGSSVFSKEESKSFLYYLVFGAIHSLDKNSNTTTQWILRNQNLLCRDKNLKADHLRAVLGQAFDCESQAIYGGLLPIHYGILMANPHCLDRLPEKLNQFLPKKGVFCSTTLAWLLASCNRWELLRESSPKCLNIDCNIAPTAFENTDRRASMAWLLSYEKQWELLFGLSQKSPEIDLNFAPVAKGNPDQGLSVAWLLASEQQWELLQHFLTENQKINLNAANLNGITLGWLFAYYRQWELLHFCYDKNPILDLNAMPRSNEHPKHGLTLGWMLGYHNQWKLLEIFLNKNLSLDLSARPYFKLVTPQFSLAECLINKKQWDLIKKAAHVNLALASKPDKYLKNLRQISQLTQFQDLILLLEVEDLEISIGSLINKIKIDKSDQEELLLFLTEEIKLFESFLSQFSETSPFYQQAQGIKLQLLTLFNDPLIYETVLEDLITHLFQPKPSKYEDNSICLQYLKAESIIKGRNFHLAMQFIEDLLNEISKLEQHFTINVLPFNRRSNIQACIQSGKGQLFMQYTVDLLDYLAILKKLQPQTASSNLFFKPERGKPIICPEQSFELNKN